MSIVLNSIKLKLSKTLQLLPIQLCGIQNQQNRNVSYDVGNLAGRLKWADWNMRRDYIRRRAISKFGDERRRLESIQMAIEIMPRELIEAAAEDDKKFPRDSGVLRASPRCAMTSRRSCKGPGMKLWRISRIMLRELSDRNKISGVQRALWGRSFGVIDPYSYEPPEPLSLTEMEQIKKLK